MGTEFAARSLAAMRSISLSNSTACFAATPMASAVLIAFDTVLPTSPSISVRAATPCIALEKAAAVPLTAPSKANSGETLPSMASPQAVVLLEIASTISSAMSAAVLTALSKVAPARTSSGFLGVADALAVANSLKRSISFEISLTPFPRSSFRLSKSRFLKSLTLESSVAIMSFPTLVGMASTAALSTEFTTISISSSKWTPPSFFPIRSTLIIGISKFVVGLARSIGPRPSRRLTPKLMSRISKRSTTYLRPARAPPTKSGGLIAVFR
mmetsp:Transcript_95233/g.269155  ORF Transcript_95233/g.269155 Transcript_95233/m.269155 type:complete len:270 (-) Transcript_95233:545-1354(-)